jgi:hypothetical protein
MDIQSSERPAAILGIAFAVWFMALVYLAASLNWRAVAVTVVIGAGIVFAARSMSRRLP